MSRRAWVLLLVGAAVLASACSDTDADVAAPPADVQVEVERDEVYLVADGVEHGVDVYVPSGDGPFPTAVVFHGRSEDGKDGGSTTLIAEAAARAGMVVFVPTWYVGDPLPLGIDDDEHRRRAGNCAVAFARSEAATHGGDAERLAVYGFSAGT